MSKRLFNSISSKEDSSLLTRLRSPSPTYSPASKVLLSPSEKQAKAQELRETLLNTKADQWRTKSEKIQAIKEKKSRKEDSKQLLESIEEKLAKAEQV